MKLFAKNTVCYFQEYLVYIFFRIDSWIQEVVDLLFQNRHRMCNNYLDLDPLRTMKAMCQWGWFVLRSEVWDYEV